MLSDKSCHKNHACTITLSNILVFQPKVMFVFLLMADLYIHERTSYTLCTCAVLSQSQLWRPNMLTSQHCISTKIADGISFQLHVSLVCSSKLKWAFIENKLAPQKAVW